MISINKVLVVWLISIFGIIPVYSQSFIRNHASLYPSRAFIQNETVSNPLFDEILLPEGDYPYIEYAFKTGGNKSNKTNEKEMIWMPDTILTYSTVGLDSRHIYSYDYHGNIINEFGQYWQNGNWRNGVKYTYTYDNNGNLLTYSYFNWQSENWEMKENYTYTYNSDGEVLTELIGYWYYGWNTNMFTNTYDSNGNLSIRLFQRLSDNIWVNSYVHFFTYDDNGNVLTDLHQDWTNNEWVNNKRTTSTYDAHGNALTILHEEWNGNVWANSYRETYTYDDNQNKLSLILEVYQISNWVYSQKQTCTYNENGQLLTMVDEDWQNNDWVNTSRQTYTYDNNGNLSLLLSEEWQTGAWQNIALSSFDYDSFGNQLNQITRVWQNSDWVNSGRFLYSYDENNNSVTGTFERWENNSWQASGDAGLNVFSNQQYLFSFSFIYMYEASFTSINTNLPKVPIESNIGIYPNPSNDYIEVNLPEKMTFSTLSVYNVLGNCLLKTQASGTSARIDIQSLAAGSYLLVVQSGGEKRVSQFVVQ